MDIRLVLYTMININLKKITIRNQTTYRKINVPTYTKNIK